MLDLSKIAYSVAVDIETWHESRTPEDGPPDEVKTVTKYFLPGGIEATTDEQIAEVRDRIRQRQEHADG